MSDQCNFWEEWKKYSLRWFHLSCSFEELHQYLIAEDSTEHISSHEIYSCKQPTPHGGRRPTQSSRESHCEWGQAYAACCCCCCLIWRICPKLSSWRPQLRENGEKGGQSSANSFLGHWKYNMEGGIWYTSGCSPSPFVASGKLLSEPAWTRASLWLLPEDSTIGNRIKQRNCEIATTVAINTHVMIVSGSWTPGSSKPVRQNSVPGSSGAVCGRTVKADL